MPEEQYLKLSSGQHICVHLHTGTFTHSRKENEGGGRWEVKEEEHRSHVKQEPESSPSETGLPGHPIRVWRATWRTLILRDQKGPVLNGHARI